MDRYIAREVIAKNPDLSRGARLLYAILDSYTRNGGNWQLKQVTLMDQLKCSKRSLQYWLAELSKAGFISVEHSATGGVNRYHMAWFAGSQAETVRNDAQSVARGGVQNVARGGAKGCADINKVFNTHIQYSPPTPPQAGGTDAHSSEGWPHGSTTCQECRGLGEVITRPARSGLRPAASADCPQCSGRGYMYAGWPGTVSIGAKAS